MALDRAQLQRELHTLENELRLTRNRLTHYDTLGEHGLAAEARRIVVHQELLKDSLTTRLQAFHVSSL